MKIYYWGVGLFPQIHSYAFEGRFEEDGVIYNRFHFDSKMEGRMPVSECLDLSIKQCEEFNKKMQKLSDEYEKRIEELDDRMLAEYTPQVNELCKTIKEEML